MPQAVPPKQSVSEPGRTESWSEWAWSWMPSWAERTPEHAGVKEPPPPARPTPVTFTLYLNELSFAFKIMEMEGSSRKRSRNLIELSVSQNLLKGSIHWPTSVKARLGIRAIYLKTIGACCCGHLNFFALNNEPTYYMSNAELPGHWEYPRDSLAAEIVAEPTEVDVLPLVKTEKEPIMEKLEKPKLDISLKSKLNKIPETSEVEKNSTTEDGENETMKNMKKENEDIQNIQAKKVSDVIETKEQEKSDLEAAINKVQKSFHEDVTHIDFIELKPSKESEHLSEKIWKEMAPVILISYSHERSPKEVHINPYENIPINFEYSDWQEECNLLISVQPLDIDIGMGLIHRLTLIKDMSTDVFGSSPLPPPRKLTVEECEALTSNLPQRKISIDVHGFSLSVHPMDHSLTTRAISSTVMLDIDLPKTNLIIVMPLYPLRVCSAAAQLPSHQTAIWRGASVHITGVIHSGQILLTSGKEKKRKPCGRLDVRFVVHSLMCRKYFEGRHKVKLSYVVKMRELNISGSAPRLAAVSEILLSYVNRRYSTRLRYSTLPKDALEDEDLVALDITAENFHLRGFFTQNVTTKLATLHAIRATLCQNEPGQEPKQAWLLAGPDGALSVPFIRVAFQWCETLGPSYVDYLACFTEHIAFAIDPLFIEWLSYRAHAKVSGTPPSTDNLRKNSQILKRRPTLTSFPRPAVSQQPPPFTEQVHMRHNSQESSSGLSEKKEQKEPTPKATVQRVTKLTKKK